ncbi:MAG: hypothetical protein ABSE84_06495 [Isosphaeraceae bacterium]
MPGTTVDIKTIAEAGVVGAGGAGFPTHVKLSGRADTVLVNAAECEPLLHKDKEVLHAYGTAVLDGLHVAMRLVGLASRTSTTMSSTLCGPALRGAWTSLCCATRTLPATRSSWSTTCWDASFPRVAYP